VKLETNETLSQKRKFTNADPSKGGSMSKNNERTSKSVASKASALLRNPKTPAKVKSVAASALTQRPNKKGGKKK
jgi:hypothetical protein